MGDLADVSELLTSKGYGSDHSDSEGEDAVNARVDLTQDYNRVAREGTRSRIILQEIGPRMELELVKVEEGMCEGRVLYHAYVKKTEEEVLELENKAVTKEALHLLGVTRTGQCWALRGFARCSRSRRAQGSSPARPRGWR